MKRLFKISNKKQDKNAINLDEILSQQKLDYSQINFTNDESDIIKSYHALNKNLGVRLRIINNLKTIIPNLNIKPILKPVYTAVLTLVIVFAVLQYKNFIDPVQYAEITVDKGEKITLHVSDNFTIYLNSESTVKVPMEQKRNSEIYLEGEAYFEIGHKRETHIIANGIRFSGKECDFHINSKEQDMLVAHVAQGTLNLYNPRYPKSIKVSLQQDDKLTYNPLAEFIAIENSSNQNYLSWHTGFMKFNKEPMYSVINTVSNYFDMPLAINNKELLNKTLTVQFTNPEIDDILDIIQSTFNCEISADGSKIIIN